MKCGDFFHCLPKRSNNADNLEFTLVVLRMVIAYYLGYPLEEFVEGIIAAVRTVPGQEEVYITACLSPCDFVTSLLATTSIRSSLRLWA